MAISLSQFATGDTDYIAKLNASMATIQAAINAMQTSQGGAAGAVTVGTFFTALFEEQTALIGMLSYQPSISEVDTTVLRVAPGTAYRGTTQTVVTGIETFIAFGGQSPGTYYIVPDAAGAPMRLTDPEDAVYSIGWNGAAFGAFIRVAKALYTVVEEDNARKSTVMNLGFSSLDLRLEAAETATKNAQDTADEAGSVATLAASQVRRVCLTIDGGTYPISPGPKGTIQVDFDGTIEGWSITGDQLGEIVVEVYKCASLPPPDPPAIPNFSSDKISASAPIGYTGARSASAAQPEVLSWNNNVAEWDVFQFNVISALSVMKATLVIRIREHTPELVMSSSLMAMTPKVAAKRLISAAKKRLERMR